MTKLPLLNKTLFLMLGILLLSSISQVHAAEENAGNNRRGQSMTELAEQVNKALINHYTAIDRFDDVSVTTDTPDARLKLDFCDGELAIKSPSNYSGGRITSHVKCTGNSTHWSLYVVSQVQLFAQVLVANTPLFRGDIIDLNDVDLALEDVSRLNNGYLSDNSIAIGKKLKRSLQTGDQIRAQWLLEPQAIKRGEKVTIIAKSANVAVETLGTALADGRLGDQIRVRNDRSDRVIRAVVSGERKVSITL